VTTVATVEVAGVTMTIGAVEAAGMSAVLKSAARSDVVSERIAGAAMIATMRVGRGEGIAMSDERHVLAHALSVGPPKKKRHQHQEQQERRAAHQAQRRRG